MHKNDLTFNDYTTKNYKKKSNSYILIFLIKKIDIFIWFKTWVLRVDIFINGMELKWRGAKPPLGLLN